MALQTLNTIKQWFKTGLKPTQAQFWDTWDSFRHKFDKIPVKEVEGLDELLLSKADKTVLDHHLADKNAHAPQVNTDWNSEFGFSQLLNKPEFKTINGEPLTGDGDIIIEAGGSQDLQTTLANGNETTNGIMFNDDYYNWLKTSIDSRSIRLTDSNSDMLVAIDSAGVVTRDDSQHVSLNPQGIFFNRDTAESYLRINTSSTGVSTVNLPATEGAEITLTATDDFKTINGESIIGKGNLNIEPQGLKSVLDADPTASYGQSKATLMGDYGTSKYNEIIVSDETEKTGIYQLKNQLSFDHTVLDSNDIGNITLSEGNVILTRYKSDNQTIVDISDPVANTQLRFPAKSEEGKTYTIATTEDFKTINGESIVGSGDILISGGDGNIPTLQEVLDKDRNATNASINLLSEEGESQTTVHEGGLNISEKTETGFLITDINKLGVSVSKDEETTFANISADELSLNKNLSGNPVKQGIVLNEDSAGTSTIKLPLTSDGDVKTLATTEDFKTINGESIVGEGDIILSEGSQDLQQTIDNGSLAVFNDSKQYVAMFNEGAPTSFGIGSSDGTYHSTLIINPDLPSIQQSSNNGDIAYVGISKNKIILSESLSAGITKIKFNPPTSISTLNFPAPSEDGEYTLPLRINGQVADKYGDVTIPTGGGSQTLDQVLAAGDEAIGKSFVIKDQNISVNNNVFVSPQSIHLFSEDKDFFMTLNNFGISSLYGDQSKGLRLKKTGLNFFEYADGGVDCTLIQNTESSGLSSVVMPLMLDGETKTLATTDDFKTINGQSIIGVGNIAVGGATLDATTAVKGIVKLTGDLGGTADNPTTPTAVHKTGGLAESINGSKTFTNILGISSNTSGIDFASPSSYTGSSTPFLNNRGGYLQLVGSTGGTGGGGLGLMLDTSLIGTTAKKVQFPNKNGVLAMVSDLPVDPITGMGNPNSIPKFTVAGVLGNSTFSEVAGSGFINGDFYINPSSGGKLTFQKSSTPFGAIGNSLKVVSGGVSDTDLNAYVYGNNPFGIWTNGVKRMTVDGNGNVSIGNFNPTNYSGYKTLTIGDNDNARSGLLKFKGGYNLGDGAEITQTNGGDFLFSLNSNNTPFSIRSNGNAQFTGTISTTGIVSATISGDDLDTIFSGMPDNSTKTLSVSFGSSTLNTPSGTNASSVIITKSDSGSGSMLLTDYQTNKMYSRARWGTWSTWVEK
ncbi:hypothetical protein NJT12_12375 [Flavobacterium sp. AC]|uniref:Uncharacterized protein n=1 Tax=Flavobacterium azizsancarii TaxID=2961580 RepID=A0ABT4WD09_9FLAO|nr:hypothetical protein [Flavobacterium azizsancarii]MDA6070417.1 hypothetical protein [Flavobacterium azizsancarii]